jgi:hypothetical protein
MRRGYSRHGPGIGIGIDRRTTKGDGDRFACSCGCGCTFCRSMALQNVFRIPCLIFGTLSCFLAASTYVVSATRMKGYTIWLALLRRESERTPTLCFTLQLLLEALKKAHFCGSETLALMCAYSLEEPSIVAANVAPSIDRGRRHSSCAAQGP